MDRFDETKKFIEKSYPLFFPYSRGINKLTHLEALANIRSTLNDMCDPRMLSALIIMAVAMKLRVNREDTVDHLCERIRNRMTEAEVVLRNKKNTRYLNELDQKLRDRARDGDLEGVIALARQGASINSQYGSALENASRDGHLNVVKYLIFNGGDDNIDRALIEAASMGHLEIVKFLVEQGADIHTGEEYPLLMAANYKRKDVVKYLVEKGADIHARNEDVLTIAVKNNDLDMVKYLVEKGAYIHAGEAINTAKRLGYSNIVTYLTSV